MVQVDSNCEIGKLKKMDTERPSVRATVVINEEGDREDIICMVTLCCRWIDA